MKISIRSIKWRREDARLAYCSFKFNPRTETAGACARPAIIRTWSLNWLQRNAGVKPRWMLKLRLTICFRCERRAVISQNIFSCLPTIRDRSSRRCASISQHLIDLGHEPYSVAGAEVLTLCRWFAPNVPIVMQANQNIHHNYPPPFNWFEQRAFKRVAAAYACSETVCEVLRAKGFAKPAPIVPFGVDTEAFRPRPLKVERIGSTADNRLHWSDVAGQRSQCARRRAREN